MDFGLDDGGREVAGLAREVLAPGTDPAALWKALGRAGLLTLSVPEELGGAGLGVLESALVLTEVGRRAAPVAALSTVALGVLPVVRAGTPAQRAALLGAVVEQDAVLSAALHEPSTPLTRSPRTRAERDGPDWVVTGTKTGVPDAADAHRLLVPVDLAGTGTGVLVVDPTAPGVEVRPTPTSSGRPECTVVLRGARSAQLLGDDDTGRALAELHRCALAGATAVGDGVLAGALELTAAHVGSRVQFGRPLATFQAVAQQVADVYIAARTLHLAARAAAWRLSVGPAFDPAPDADLDVAAHWLAEQAPPALHTCQHLHGGLGVDAGYPLHHHFGLGRDLARAVGGVEHTLDRLAARAATD
ncbi:acyl-CoA dehydrogenase family protein [Pseudonocardia humida]|uniref:Acyl-CoA/acyl-ACP dehydrogenase n=1 Tax=Pseudonocardia humida TaxID=2800819 RepID=A0ABT0ZXM4_9PSEU|nr:acyl-CoA dehydrogenase family protein [Pseudonocardia humida]MCO1655493.1 acyl-CoA/acyl-ACP dehydrogenase [Pseudonocardia humida]